MFISATDLGFSSDPAIDNTPAWNAAIAAGGPDCIYLNGLFRFKTRPNPILRPMRMEGANLNLSCLYRDYQPLTLTEPFIEARATFHLEKTSFNAPSGGQGIGLQFTGLAASGSVYRDGYISAAAGAHWAIPLSLQSSDSLGIRSCCIDNVELFAATTHILWLCNAQGLTMQGVDCYPAGGTVSHATIQGQAGYRSAAINWTTRYLAQAYVYDTDNMTITGISPASLSINNSTNIRQL